MSVASIGSVNEKSMAHLTVKFKDKTGALSAPTAATWEVHDLESGTQLLAPTNIAPIAATVDLILTPTINTIFNPLNREEIRRVTIKATGSSVLVNDEVDYNLINLSYVT